MYRIPAYLMPQEIKGKSYVNERAYKEQVDELCREIKEKDDIIWTLTNRIENEIQKTKFFPESPVDAASMLINAKVECEPSPLQRAFGGENTLADRYSDDDLRQIAEHLFVYCNHNSED